jgi:uncharacterized membrane protein YphA (DoxX/SURF4 family)
MKKMEWIPILIQLIIAVSIVNVWIIRFGKPTSWRGGSAQNMKEEFRTYGLPHWFMTLIGASKLLLASLLIVGIWLPELVRPAAIGMAVLMLGAIAMHIKVKDSLIKSLPAFTFLVLSLVLVFI